jgi:hypothetical protein
VVNVTDTESVSESRAARKEAQSLLSQLEAQLHGRHFGDDEQGKIDALSEAVQTSKAITAALERALAAKQG